MSLATESQQFQLVLDGAPDLTDSARAEISAVLAQSCGFEIIEVDELLDGTPHVIRSAHSKEELEALSHQLLKSGARVQIVRARGTVVEPKKPAVLTPEHVDPLAFKEFYLKYATKLSAILRAMAIDEVTELLNDLIKARHEQRQIIVFGNGGSAATASHMANDFAKPRFPDEASQFRVMSITDNMSWITATANDEGYDLVFVNQLRSLMRQGDLVIAISSSGNSPNVIRAVEYANRKGATTYGIVGFKGGGLKQVAKKSIYIPTKPGQYGYMEDVTLIINHILSVFIYEQDRARQNGE